MTESKTKLKLNTNKKLIYLKKFKKLNFRAWTVDNYVIMFSKFIEENILKEDDKGLNYWSWKHFKFHRKSKIVNTKYLSQNMLVDGKLRCIKTTVLKKKGMQLCNDFFA